MSQTQETLALDGRLDSLTQCFDAESARRLVEFKINPDDQAKVDALAARANEGLLTDEERADYEAFINAADLISILKLKAQRRLVVHGTP
jgi:hypothetical protein